MQGMVQCICPCTCTCTYRAEAVAEVAAGGEEGAEVVEADALLAAVAVAGVATEAAGLPEGDAARRARPRAQGAPWAHWFFKKYIFAHLVEHLPRKL